MNVDTAPATDRRSRRTPPRLEPTWFVASALCGVAALQPPSGRFLQACVFVALFTAFGAAGDRLAQRSLRGLGPLHGPSRLVAGFTATCALLLTGMTLFGAAGLLVPPVLFAAGALVAGVLAWMRSTPSPSPELRAHLGAWCPVVLALAIVVAAEWGAPDPPGTRHYDDNSYHLPAVATWRSTHDLSTLKFGFGDPSTTFYPLAGEVFTWILLAPFDDSDVLARWAQLPFALASLAAVVSIGRRLGFSTAASTLSALAFVSTPRAFPALALSAGNDHVLSFFVLAALDAALALAAAPAIGPAILLGAALGVAAGTKYLGLFAAGTVLLAATALSSASARRWLAASFAVALVVGGYTYLRNWRSVGNPVFPQPVTIGAVELFPGWSGTSLEMRRDSDPAALRPRQFPRFLWERTDLFGPLFRWVTLPAYLLALILALVRFRAFDPAPRRLAVVLVLPLVWFLLFAYFVHDHRDVRYFFHALALGGLGAGLLFDRWARWPAWPDRTPRTTTGVRRLAAAGAGGLLALGLAIATPAYQERKFDRAPRSVQRLDELTIEGGATIAYLGSNQPYWFWGRRLQNRVEIVPARGPLVDRHYRWGGNASFSRNGRSFRAWDRNLRRLEAEYVVVARRTDASEPVERHWMTAMTDRFDLVFADEAAEIWRIRG